METQGNRFYAIDLLRFGAAFAVVLYHLTARPDSSFEALSEITKYGYLGVPVFFMISGYVIAMSAQGRTAYQFGVARFARLYPGLWAGMAFTIMVLSLTGADAPDMLTVITNAMLINDYTGQPDIDGVYWTLHTELKFYACVFLLVAAGLFPKYKLWLSAWLGLTILHSLTGQPSFMGWFISPGWSPYFIAGIAMFLMSQNRPDPFNATVLACALFMGAIHSYSAASGFIPGSTVTDQLTASGLFLLFALALLAIALRIITINHASWVVTLGAMTYPLYLIHNKAGKALVDGPLSGFPEGVAVSLVVGLTLICSYLIFRFVERPSGNAVRRFGFSLPGRISSFRAAAAKS